MRRVRFMISIIYVMISPVLGLAEEIDGMIFIDPAWMYIDNNKEFKVAKIDEVSDGCWVSTGNSQDKVELEIIRSGGTIVDEKKSLRPIVEVYAFGYGIGMSCFVVAEVNVRDYSFREIYSEGRQISSVYLYKLWSRSVLLTGPKDNMSSRISDEHQNLIQSFLVELSKNSEFVRNKVVENASEATKDFWRDHVRGYGSKKNLKRSR